MTVECDLREIYVTVSNWPCDSTEAVSLAAWWWKFVWCGVVLRNVVRGYTEMWEMSGVMQYGAVRFCVMGEA